MQCVQHLHATLCAIVSTLCGHPLQHCMQHFQVTWEVTVGSPLFFIVVLVVSEFLSCKTWFADTLINCVICFMGWTHAEIIAGNHAEVEGKSTWKHCKHCCMPQFQRRSHGATIPLHATLHAMLHRVATPLNRLHEINANHKICINLSHINFVERYSIIFATLIKCRVDFHALNFQYFNPNINQFWKPVLTFWTPKKH